MTTVLVAVVGPAAALLHVGLTGRLMGACDIGVAPGLVLLFMVLPVLLIVDPLVVGVVFTFGYRVVARWFPPARRSGRFGVGMVAFLAMVLALVLVAWALLAFSIPEAYTVVCPNVLVLWWPSWLPL